MKKTKSNLLLSLISVLGLLASNSVNDPNKSRQPIIGDLLLSWSFCSHNVAQRLAIDI